MKVNLRKIIYDDWPTLLKWANDDTMRKNAFNQNKITKDEHLKYIERILSDDSKNIYILELDDIPVATIKDSLFETFIELSYNVCPSHRGKKLSILLLTLYLYEKTGKFLCRIKNDNVPSVRMVERCGFTLDKQVDGVMYYVLQK
jgi:RimJ/RimL family protein N-acetyltransferase